MLPVSKQPFLVLLGASLLVASALLIAQPERETNERRFTFVGPLIAAPMRLLSGIVGIGGGIFLAPVLHPDRLGPRQARRGGGLGVHPRQLDCGPSGD